MIDVHYASLTSQGVQHRVFYRDGHPSRYQPRPTGLNFGEQTGTGVFPLVIAVLSNLCKSKATGLDKISARLPRECADLVASSLCSIFNISIVSGVFPIEWKSTKVIPLFKQGERSDLNNYRPISIIPVVAKVFERIVYNQFYEYLTENNLISCNQSGFRSLHSTATALLEATDNQSFTGLLISIKVMLMQ